MVGHGGKNDRFWREKRRSSADAGVVPVVAHRVTHPIAHFKRSHCLGVNRVEDVVLLRAQVSKAHLLGILSLAVRICQALAWHFCHLTNKFVG